MTTTGFHVYAYPREPYDASRRTVVGEKLIDGVLTVSVDGRQCGEVHRGTNCEWYWVSLNEATWADPLQGLDNLANTGWSSPVEAALSGLEMRPAVS